MPHQHGKIALSFTGGKDCVLALHLIAGFESAANGDLSPVEAIATERPVHGACAVAEACAEGLAQTLAPIPAILVTFVPKPNGDGSSVRFKAHPLEVVSAQAAAMGMQHLVLEVEGPAFLQSYQQHIQRLHDEHGVTALVTGDILDVCDGFMTKAVHGTGVKLVTPLWHAERRPLLHMLEKLHVRALVSCVNLRKFAEAAAAQRHAKLLLLQEQGLQAQDQEEQPSECPASPPSEDWDGEPPAAATQLLGSWVEPVLCDGLLSGGVDQCGERGEYHTLVTDAPLFKQRLLLHGKPVREGDFLYLQFDSIELEQKGAGGNSFGPI